MQRLYPPIQPPMPYAEEAPKCPAAPLLYALGQRDATPYKKFTHKNNRCHLPTQHKEKHKVTETKYQGETRTPSPPACFPCPVYPPARLLVGCVGLYICRNQLCLSRGSVYAYIRRRSSDLGIASTMPLCTFCPPPPVVYLAPPQAPVFVGMGMGLGMGYFLHKV